MNVFKKIKSLSNPTIEELTALRTKIQKNFEILSSEFRLFADSSSKIIIEAKKKLNEPINNDPVILEEMLSELISHLNSVGEAHTKAKTFQQYYTVLYYIPKSKEYSEEDRKNYTGLKGLEQNYLVSVLKGMEERIDKKISVCQSFLKYEAKKYNLSNRG